ncbi:MAG: DUF1841 family protein [Gammaproteobacteria bacterium]|nr:DUF1841 family protein [Gammaproteobacteria bacterium]
MFGNDRSSLRTVFFNAWQKHQNQAALEPLEQQIVALLIEHPEYQAALSDWDKHGDRDYQAEVGEANPFLHLSLHLAIRDQANMDRPPGVRKLLAALTAAAGEPHRAEHLAMEQLQQLLWEAQHSGGLPDEDAYLASLARLADKVRQPL